MNFLKNYIIGMDQWVYTLYYSQYQFPSVHF